MPFGARRDRVTGDAGLYTSQLYGASSPSPATLSCFSALGRRARPTSLALTRLSLHLSHSARRKDVAAMFASFRFLRRYSNSGASAAAGSAACFFSSCSTHVHSNASQLALDL